MQFRELEFVLGYKRQAVMKFHRPDFPGYDLAEKRLRERSVVDHFYDFLKTQKIDVPPALFQRDHSQPNEPDETVQEGLLRLYQSRPDLVILFEVMTDFDEGFQEWRYRHVKLVERTIGSKHGTGGSPGVEFLKKSLFQPVFADLWAIRHKL
jgi:tryptophan 2,3-dioxygenase